MTGQGCVERQKATCRDDGPRCHCAPWPDRPSRHSSTSSRCAGKNKQTEREKKKKKGRSKRKHGRTDGIYVYKVYVAVRLMFDGHFNPEILHILYRTRGAHLLPRRRRPLSPGREHRNNSVPGVPISKTVLSAKFDCSGSDNEKKSRFARVPSYSVLRVDVSNFRRKSRCETRLFEAARSAFR